MGHHVHGADAQHGAVHVVAMEHVVHVVIFLQLIEEDLFLVVLFQILTGGNKKAGGTAGRVADHVVRPGLHQLYHHADDVAGRAELTVNTGGSDLTEEVFINIAAGIAVLHLRHLLINAVQSSDDLIQHQRRGDFENGVVHILGVGAGLIAVERLDEREHPLLHSGVHFSRGEIVKYRPLQLISRNGAVTDFDLVSKDAFVWQAQHGALFGPQIVGIVQIADKHQIGHLLHNVQRVGDAAGPKNFPKAVDSIFQFASNHLNPSPSSKCTRCSVRR